MRRILSFICIFSLMFSAYGQETVSGDSSSVRSKNYVHMLHTDVTRFDEKINPDAWILVGDVRFRRDSMYMFCDSAHYFQKKNAFQAFGNVRMEQGDTLFLYGDYLDYDGDTNLARVRHNVRLIDNNTTLTTDSLDFDRNKNLGYFIENGTLFDGESTLSSRYGEYDVDTKDAFFQYKVVLEHPDFKLLSDTLRYNTDNKIAIILGPTNMYSGESEVYSERGRYNTVDKLAYLLDRSVLYNDNKDVTADSIFYNMNSGFSEVFGNIVYNDTVNRNMLTGEYAYLNEVVDSAYVTGRAVVTDYSQKDSLFMHADTIWAVSYNLDTDSLYRQVKAYNKVRAWGKEMQAVCDSLIFDSRDSCMTMYKDPILWNNGIQLLGEEIKIYMDTASIDWVHIINQTLYAEYVDSSESADYNQVKGQEMKFYFDDGKINEMQVIGSVEIIFYPIDDSDSTYVGMNTTVAGRITAYLKDGQVERLFVPKEAKGVLYPMGQRPSDKRFLDNFVWFDYVRPLSKEDIFNWRGKGSNLELKVIRRENIPLPTLDGMKGKEE